MRVLLVEDDSAVAETVRRGLVVDGHFADLAPDARTARTLASENSYDAILLDLNLPDASGYDLIGELRQSSPQVPVLMVTGRTDTDDVLHGFDVGADDYITKPFEVRELLARLRAVTRRSTNTTREILNFEDIELDRLRREVRCGETRLRVTPKEFGVLELLMLEDGSVASRRVLLEQVWEVDYDPGTNVVDVQITHLRTKLRQAGSRVRIANVRGTGFRLTLDTTAETGVISEEA
jgi:two-component system, OmpR family, copper resistance phosphate regulon response regulator CusR